MKHLKSSAILQWIKKIPIRELNFEIILCLSLVLPNASYGQLNELAQELQQSNQELTTIADIIISAVKTIAGVSVILGALVFLYLREQQSDLTKKVGTVIIGIALFWVLLAIGDNMRN